MAPPLRPLSIPRSIARSVPSPPFSLSPPFFSHHESSVPTALLWLHAINVWCAVSDACNAVVCIFFVSLASLSLRAERQLASARTPPVLAAPTPASLFSRSLSTVLLIGICKFDVPEYKIGFILTLVKAQIIILQFFRSLRNDGTELSNRWPSLIFNSSKNAKEQLRGIPRATFYDRIRRMEIEIEERRRDASSVINFFNSHAHL